MGRRSILEKEVLERSPPVCSFKIGYADDFQDGLVESLNFAVVVIARSLELMPPHGQKSGVREAGVMVVYVLYTWGI